MQNYSNADVSSDTQNELSDLLSLLNNIPTNTEENKDTKLLNSLKPYLNEKRRKKLNQCENLMSITETLKTLNDLHLFESIFNNTDE